MDIPYIAPVLVFLDRITKNKYWLLFLLIFCCIWAYFQVNYTLYRPNMHIWETRELQIAHPLTPQTHDISSHSSKVAYRLLVPVFAHILGLSLNQVVVLQHIFIIFFLIFTYQYGLKISNDKVIASLLTICFASTYPSLSFLYDRVPYFDSYGYLLMVILLLIDNQYFKYLILFLGFWVDERFVLCSSYFVLGELFFKDFKEKKSPSIIIYLCIYSTYFAVRYYLKYSYGLNLPLGNEADISFSLIKSNISNFPLSFVSGIEFLYFIIFISFLFFVKREKYSSSFIILILFIITHFSSFCVLDVTRSISYNFILLLLSTRYLCKIGYLKSLKKILVLITGFCMIWPMHVHIIEVHMHYPMFLNDILNLINK